MRVLYLSLSNTHTSLSLALTFNSHSHALSLSVFLFLSPTLSLFLFPTHHFFHYLSHSFSYSRRSGLFFCSRTEGGVRVRPSYMISLSIKCANRHMKDNRMHILIDRIDDFRIFRCRQVVVVRRCS